VEKITYSIADLVAFICAVMKAVRCLSFNGFGILIEGIPTKRGFYKK